MTTRPTAEDALLQLLQQRVNDFYAEEWDPEAPQVCLACARVACVPEPLVRGWGIVCVECLAEEVGDG
jgi:hypothetical protein